MVGHMGSGHPSLPAVVRGASFALAVVGFMAVLLGVTPSPAGAEDPVVPTTTTSSTTPPTTVPAEIEDDGPTTTIDLLLDEPQGETAPETDQTVPAPTGTYGGQAEFEPPKVLWSSVRRAKRKLAEATTVLEASIEDVREVRTRYKVLGHRREALTFENRQAMVDLEQAEIHLQERAVAAFVSDDAATNALIGSVDASGYDQVLDLQARRTLLDVVLAQDEEAIEVYLRLRAKLDRAVASVHEAQRRFERRLVSTVSSAELAKDEVAQAENELEAFRAGSAIYISGVVFPLAQPYDLPLIDSFGFPRMPGTPDEHWHEGIDIFAPSGTPLLAAERGVITRVGSGRLGGLTFWLRGESGADWYYAHLLSYVPGLAAGQVVEAGEVLGFVGNTGNAISTPPHVHLEVHPGGDKPVNPYPLLKVVSDRDQAAASSG